MDTILFAMLSALSLWLLVLTTPLKVRLHLMWFSWFLDVGFGVLLAWLFKGSTQGALVAILGALFITIMRVCTVAIDKRYGRAPRAPWQGLVEYWKKVKDSRNLG